MKSIGRIILLVIAACLVIFAVANRGPTTLNLWPLPFAATLPLYIVLLGALAFGIILGGIIAWVSGHRWRRRAREAERRIEALDRQLATLTREARDRDDRPGGSIIPAAGSRRSHAAAISDD